jgi:nitrite reductase/ring-hydroxylating ferredoxin subunit
VVGTAAEFPEGRHRVVRIGNREIGIFNIRGTLYGLPNLCPHQTGPLCEGKYLTGTLRAQPGHRWRLEWVHDGEIITCPWHGLEYHVPTGQCLAFPEIRLRTYEVSVKEDGTVVVRV